MLGRSSEAPPESPPLRAAPIALPAASVHRALSCLAAVSLLIALHAVWVKAVADRPVLGALITISYLLIAAGAVAAALVPAAKLPTLDLGVLALGLAIRVIQFAPVFQGQIRYTVDEGVLSNQATHTLLAGHNPYGPSWPHLVAGAPTELFGGGVADHYSYPPLGALLGAAAGELSGRLATPAFVDLLALIAGAFLMFLALPRLLRPLAVVLVLSLGFVTSSALAGFPAVLLLPFLVAALWWWPRTWRRSTWGFREYAGAVCLGLAATSQQLAWFFIPFLVVGVALCGAPQRSGRTSVALAARYAAVVAGTFVLVNLPFVVMSPHDWARGVTDVLLQHAALYGIGFPTISAFYLGGSGGLVWFSVTTALLYLVELALFLRWPQRLAPVVPVMAVAPLLFSNRSEDVFYTLLCALWPFALVVCRAPALDSGPIPRRGRLAVSAGAAALGAGAVASLLAGFLTPAPLTIHVGAVTAAPHGRISAAVVTARNRSGQVVRPHFAFVANASMSDYWTITSGPTLLQPGQRATYQLAAPPAGTTITTATPLRVWALSDRPEAISTGS